MESGAPTPPIPVPHDSYYSSTADSIDCSRFTMEQCFIRKKYSDFEDFDKTMAKPTESASPAEFKAEIDCKEETALSSRWNAKSILHDQIEEDNRKINRLSAHLVTWLGHKYARCEPTQPRIACSSLLVVRQRLGLREEVVYWGLWWSPLPS